MMGERFAEGAKERGEGEEKEGLGRGGEGEEGEVGEAMEGLGRGGEGGREESQRGGLSDWTQPP